jgi:uncharacterized repeat protein (TIGR01451 family)
VTRDNFGGTVDNPAPDLVVFITDGKPTTRTSGAYTDLGAGVEAANLLKASGSRSPRPHITGVAVGDLGADGLTNIAALSGSDDPAGSGVGGADPDVHQSDTSTLIDDMKELATQLCGGTVTLHKTLQTSPDAFVPADGWEFASSTADPVAVTTDRAGVANLKFADAGTKAVTESGPAGYVMQRVDCGDARLSGVGPAGFSVDVSHSAVINCAVVNAPVLGSIAVHKVTRHGVGGPFGFEVSGQNAVSTVLSATTDAENVRTPAGVVSGLFPGRYTIDETSMPPGWVLTGIDCGDATVAKPENAELSPTVDVDVHPGEKVACTFTDDELSSDLSILKAAADPIAVNAGADQQIDYTLGIDNRGRADAHAAATVTDMLPANASLVSITPPEGVACTPSLASEITCTVRADQLEAADPPVMISISVTVPTGSDVVVNQSMVSSPDDPAPCTVTSHGITCHPTDTNNFSEVSSAVPSLPTPSPTPPAAGPPRAPGLPTPAETPVQVEARVASLALTGSGSVRLLALGTALVIVGASVLLLRRRRRSNP